MNKKEFLEELKRQLKNLKNKETKDILNYYEELIDERIESNEKEEDIIESFNVDDIIKKIKLEFNIKESNHNPTISNNFKVLIAILGVLSLPMLIPFIIVIISLIFVALVLLLSLIIVIASIAFASILSLIAAFSMFFTGKLTIASLLLLLGTVSIFIGLSIIGINLVIRLIKYIVNHITKQTVKGVKKRGIINE